MYRALTSNLKQTNESLNYFLTGSNKKEAYPFIREFKENMIRKGIINNVHDEITFNKLLQSRLKIKPNTKDSRLIDITPPWDWKRLAEAMNEAPAVVPIGLGLGLGATQYKQGGTINDYVEAELTLKEIKDLIAQGYVIEELN